MVGVVGSSPIAPTNKSKTYSSFQPSSTKEVRKYLRGLLALLLLLPGIAAGWEISPKRSDAVFLVELRFMDREAVIASCSELGAWEGDRPKARQPAGCNAFYPDRAPKLCVIIAERPREDRDERMTTLGHEFYHCTAGAYHDAPW
jgi:hypothetical protein